MKKQKIINVKVIKKPKDLMPILKDGIESIKMKPKNKNHKPKKITLSCYDHVSAKELDSSLSGENKTLSEKRDSLHLQYWKNTASIGEERLLNTLMIKIQKQDKKCFDRIKKKINNPSGEVNCSVRMIHQIINEEIGDDLR